MPIIGHATHDQAAERLEVATSALDVVREPLDLDGIDFLEALTELRSTVAADLLPDDVDVSIPGTLRVSIWRWRPHGDEKPSSYLAEVRVGCHRTTVRYSFPIATVFNGDEKDRAALIEAGFACEPGNVSLLVYNDVSIGRISSDRIGTLDVKIHLRDEIEPAGLQWNLAAMLNMFPDGDGCTLGVTLVRHSFDKMKRGGVEMHASGPMAEVVEHGNVGQAISGLSATGRVRLEIPRPLHTEVAANR